MIGQDMVIKILDLKAQRIRTVKVDPTNFGGTLIEKYAKEINEEKRFLGRQNINTIEEVINLINNMGNEKSQIQILDNAGNQLLVRPDNSWESIPPKKEKPKEKTYSDWFKSVFKNKLRKTKK